MNLGCAKLLLVEKNAKLADLWHAFMTRRGFDCAIHIYGTSDAGKLKEWGQPDVIISGLERLDGRFMSGEEIWLHVYGEQPERHLIPVIQLTSSYLQQDGGGPLRGPAFAYLQKPVKLSELLGVVKRACFQTLKVDCQSSKSPTMTAELTSNALVGVLQFIGSGFRNGILLAESQAGEAAMVFVDGSPMSAYCGSLKGDEAVYETMTWTSGQATFYAGTVDPGERNINAENVGQLIEVAQSQIAAIAKAEALLASPNTQIKTGSTAMDSADPVKRQIISSLPKEKTLKELFAILPDFSYRQVMVALAGMLAEGQITQSGKPRAAQGLSPEFCAEMLKGFEGGDFSIQITHPPKIMVYSPTPSLAARFIGALCETELAASVIIRYLNLMLVVADAQKVDSASAFSDTAAVVVALDPQDAPAMPRFHSFMDLLSGTGMESAIVAYLDRGVNDTTPKATSSSGKGFRTTKFDFNQKACLGVIASIMKVY